jgi:hypothetical protein
MSTKWGHEVEVELLPARAVKQAGITMAQVLSPTHSELCRRIGGAQSTWEIGNDGSAPSLTLGCVSATASDPHLVSKI